MDLERTETITAKPNGFRGWDAKTISAKREDLSALVVRGTTRVICQARSASVNPYLRAKLYEAMRPCLTSKCPFANLPSSRTSHFGEGITTEEMKELCWLKPKLVAQISFTEWTNYGLLRHATFEGLRDDKEPCSVIREVAAGVSYTPDWSRSVCSSWKLMGLTR